MLLANSACYYATGPINDSGLFVPIGVVLNGTDADDTVGQVNGTFNGGAGNDSVSGYLGDSGTFNGGKGDDYMQALSDAGTFNGGPGDDTTGFMYDGTFSGGAGSDVVNCLYGGTTWSVTEGICD